MRKKNSLSREQAMELYDDLEKAMGSLIGEKPIAAAARMTPPPRAQAAYQQKKQAHVEAANNGPSFSSLLQMPKTMQNGKQGAVTFLVVLGLLKIATACIDASGIMGVAPAQASLNMAPVAPVQNSLIRGSAEEKKILTALDDRRVSLEERARKLDQQQKDLERRDQESAGRLTELREMTNLLKLDRDKGEKKRSTQIEQLANVYGSMDPKEAASLIEQLDFTIALGLLQKMPEKRIAQILALMTPERALAITKMLSGELAPKQ